MKRTIFGVLTGIAMIANLQPARADEPKRESSGPALTAPMRTEVIEGILNQLNTKYVFPEVAKKMEDTLRKRLKEKEYDSLTDGQKFAETLTQHLQEVSKDKHLRVRFSPEPMPERSTGEPSPEQQERMREENRAFGNRINYGFEKVERLRGNIGYLDLRMFFEASLAGETAAAAMNFLGNSNALIIDLRQNGGGDPDMVALLCSYLFGSEPVHLNDIYWRPDDSTRQFWTLPSVPGKRFTGKDIYVLTSKRTFSGAEEFTYNLKNLKRATILGETTGGGAHPGGSERITAHFSAFVPMGRAINPISKTNWEGTGVKPDLEIPAEQALKTAHVMALKKEIERTKDERFKEALKDALATVQKELDEMKAQPVKTTSTEDVL
jgi:retinol-binding protein 3